MTALRNVSVPQALELLAQGAVLVDVREANEWDQGHAPGARHVALGELAEREESLPDQLIVCVCRSGGRSTRAAEFLLERGRDVVNLDGGMLAWAASGEALVGGDEASVV